MVVNPELNQLDCLLMMRVHDDDISVQIVNNNNKESNLAKIFLVSSQYIY